MKAPNRNQSNQNQSNDFNRTHADNRKDTQKHRYEEYDETLTNDENFKEGRQKRNTDMDFRDKNENLEADA